MKVLVVDNETAIREGIAKMLVQYCPFVDEVLQAEGVVSGTKTIKEMHPDVVLLDVELDDGTGMDLLSELGTIDFQLIFITAHNKYAINAFKFSAIDFLLKPLMPEELVQALTKADRQIKNKFLDQQILVLQETLDKIASKEKKIVLKDSDSIYFINVMDIVRCQAYGQYTEFFIDNNKKIVISRSLKEYEELLEPYGFIRPHHSHIINMGKILRFDRMDGGILVMENEDEVPVSQRKKTQVLQLFENL